MKKVIILIIAVLFAFSVAAASLAVEEKKAAPAPIEKKAQPKIKQITGEVKAIDSQNKTITVTKKVKDKVQEATIIVDDKTLADIKAGDYVQVQYAAGEKNTARSVVKKTEAKKTEPKQTETVKKPVKK